MRFSLTYFFLAALVSTGGLAAPNPANKVDLRFTQDGMVQRLADDGTILDEKVVPARELEKLKAVAVQSQRRGDDVFAKRSCIIAHPCNSDTECWNNGCVGCLFISTNSGVCYGSIW
ncbi:hypothetical protein B0H67DRAFT_610996 [Lasiosphaeris hirsuta]|uniref:Uncharacterized protein n=1 Tax=Lasiosphaeris hirsuta TaxID=260670 RepID=A0AA40DP16_9PEZI|nr:hypothetical protein B0H67DRAFT_610996 [Lasiosphaeris hirsuta]